MVMGSEILKLLITNPTIEHNFQLILSCLHLHNLVFKAIEHKLQQIISCSHTQNPMFKIHFNIIFQYPSQTERHNYFIFQSSLQSLTTTLIKICRFSYLLLAKAAAVSLNRPQTLPSTYFPNHLQFIFPFGAVSIIPRSQQT
jgi:hypothetical protein